MSMEVIMKKLLGFSVLAVFCSFILVSELNAQNYGQKMKEAKANVKADVEAKSKTDVKEVKENVKKDLEKKKVEANDTCTAEQLTALKAEQETLYKEKKECKDKAKRSELKKKMKEKKHEIKSCAKSMKKAAKVN